MSEFKIGDRIKVGAANWFSLMVPDGTQGVVVEAPQGSCWEGVHVQFDTHTPQEVEDMFGYPTWPVTEEEIEHA